MWNMINRKVQNQAATISSNRRPQQQQRQHVRGTNSSSKKSKNAFIMITIFFVILFAAFIGLIFNLIFVLNNTRANNAIATTNNNNNNNNINNIPIIKQQPQQQQLQQEPLVHHQQERTIEEQEPIEEEDEEDDHNDEDERMILSTLEEIRNDFYNRYGGQEIALEMYTRGIQSYGNSLDATAQRIIQAKINSKPFVMSFAGYSVTVGRGNFFNQSYPFIMQNILKKAFHQFIKATTTSTTEGILEEENNKNNEDGTASSLIVHNAAIGGIPSFPYGFCLEHFLGIDADVISWDYSMNEKPGSSSVLEAYIRQGLSQLIKQPMFIMLDTDKRRCSLLSKYTTTNITTLTNENHVILKDAISVAKADGILDGNQLKLIEENKKKDIKEQQEILPIGLQSWDEFGAPKRCPGRGSWHPKKKEHELIGWIIAMYFVNALQKAYDMIATTKDWKIKYNQQNQERLITFPPAMVPVPDKNDPSVTDLLYGHQQAHGVCHIKQISCRTNFLPAQDHKKILESIIVSGFNTLTTSDNIMEDRTDEHYSKGWVLDVSFLERDTKKKVLGCGGLGYIDMKIALYGIPESGKLSLFLPYEGDGKHIIEGNTDKERKLLANHWFDDNIIICEANEKRDPDACKLHEDIQYTIGGIDINNQEQVTLINGAGEYLKRKTCINIKIPKDAKISNKDNNNDQQKEKHGLMIDILAKSNVSKEKGACCISHIVWENN